MESRCLDRPPPNPPPQSGQARNPIPRLRHIRSANNPPCRAAAIQHPPLRLRPTESRRSLHIRRIRPPSKHAITHHPLLRPTETPLSIHRHPARNRRATAFFTDNTPSHRKLP
ncbi:hypothetical protein BJY04DRAFT_199066 [Aspergillus karnatakaensis]|uniref:uncharacterized protein n=1 Tax=Aspergillus karnatakaensis TaxID=1810916 RepID=UPI003CCC924C